MKQGWHWVLVVAGMVGAIILDSCKHGKCEGGGTSQHGSDESHNAGTNCMSCHHPDAGEAPCWQLAGTAYQPGGNTPLANATLLLFSRPLGRGTLLRTIDYDALGNVYTGDPCSSVSGSSRRCCRPKVTPRSWKRAYTTAPATGAMV